MTGERKVVQFVNGVLREEFLGESRSDGAWFAGSSSERIGGTSY